MDKNNLKRYNSDILSKSLKIKNVDTISNTTSSLMPQKGGYLNNNKNKDINQLMSMLSATSESNYTTNSTNTEEIKNKLLNILQDGGGWKEDYEELEDTFRRFNEYVILLNVKSLENWKIIKDSGFEDEIISILNNLHLREKKDFLQNEIGMFLLSNQEILMNHPILLLIYNNIMSKIIDKSNPELNKIIQEITKELYEQISKIISHYLKTPPKQTDDDKRQDPFQTEKTFLYYFYDMLTNTRNNIEQVLISYIRLPRSATAVASSSRSYTPQPSSMSERYAEQPRLFQDSRAFIEQPFSSRLLSAAASSYTPLPRSATAVAPPAQPRSLPPAPQPRWLPAAAASASAASSSAASSASSSLSAGPTSNASPLSTNGPCT
jgi:hypothetical protein